MIQKVLKLLFVFCLFGFQYAEAQTTVTGVVTDGNSGIPLAGANIIVKGTSNGVSTDFDGKYSINVSSTSATLVFTYIGYTSKEVVVNSQATIDVSLEEDANQLDEIVVTALGIKREKKSLGYAVSTIKSEQIEVAGSPVNPLESLYGNAAGVVIQTGAGGPTGGMIVNIRNTIALNSESSTRPLFVVDGIPIFDEETEVSDASRDRGTGINDINAADIASIEVLKGAKAAVLYGGLGANGVVLITTKTGKRRKGLGVEISSNFSWSEVAFVPEYQNQFGSGANAFVAGTPADEVSNDGFLLRDGVESYPNNTPPGSFGPRLDGRNIVWWDGVARPYTAQPDNTKELFDSGHQTSQTISFSNAGDIGNFRASYTYKDFGGLVVNSGQESHNVNISANLNASDKVHVGFNTSYFYADNLNAPNRLQALISDGLRRDTKIDLLKQNIINEDGYYVFGEEGAATGLGGLTSVAGYLWNQNRNINREQRHHLVQSLKIDFDLAKWLTWSTRVGIDLTLLETEDKRFFTRPLEDDGQGRYSVNNRNIFKLYGQSDLIFDYKINDDFRVDGLLGMAYTSNRDRSSGGSINQTMFVENWFSLNNTTNPNGAQLNHGFGSDTMYGFYGSAQLSYREQLFLEVQGRNDVSSILPKDNNSYFYPGASASWLASQSLDLPDVIKFAKLRVSWADVGRPGPRYFGVDAFNAGTYGNSPYFRVDNRLPPPNLKPERKREVEFGIDMNFFNNNRFGFEASYYMSDTYDQIMGVDVPQSSGFNQITINAGQVETNGWEVLFKGKPILTENFSWNASLSLSGVKSTVTDLTDGVDIHFLRTGISENALQVRAERGEEFGDVFVHPYARNEAGEQLIADNGQFIVDRSEWKKVGNIRPDITGGFNSTFQYKNFDLNIGLNFQFGGVLPSTTEQFLVGTGNAKSTVAYRDEANGGLPYYVNDSGSIVGLDSHSAAVPADSRYGFIFHDGLIIPGVNENTGQANDVIIPAQTYYQQYWQGDQAIFEDRIFKSDYLSIRRVALGWNAPKSITSKANLSKLRISAYVNNLAYLFTDLPNVNPESVNGTRSPIENSAIPVSRSFGLSVNMGF
ncbi:SusC/RagA family TonB-linked outer membrane protein [Flavivirga spongiicola]|uniref:SusC/RagA family TonB-linked outer membrane protein n=1 Tax=Flavivirga spongiicola TaxID=421621 RepID=A0ABU7XTT5_9FLAO|nr:SusC/RagA family TonB-linked outer membrane protein [Flavivirga sp. MEBiC05379]MDO5978344.1 SusC/RagA family TonB-linked outer membrane protein [Flavivirga sp. MEBiC05379]